MFEYTICAFLAPALAAAVPWPGPQPTFVMPKEDNWSPAPTTAPKIGQAELLRRADDNICGYISGKPDNSLTCNDPGYVCQTNADYGVHGCCDPNVSPCSIFTTCIASSDIADKCTNDCIANDYIAKCTAADSPSCYEWHYVYPETIMTEHGCAASAFTISAWKSATSPSTSETLADVIMVDSSTDGVDFPPSTQDAEAPEETAEATAPQDAEPNDDAETTAASNPDTPSSDSSFNQYPDPNPDQSSGTSEDQQDDEETHPPTHTGAIVGGVIGGTVLLTALAVLTRFLLSRQWRTKQTTQHSDQPSNEPKLHHQTSYDSALVPGTNRLSFSGKEYEPGPQQSQSQQRLLGMAYDDLTRGVRVQRPYAASSYHVDSEYANSSYANSDLYAASSEVEVDDAYSYSHSYHQDDQEQPEHGDAYPDAYAYSPDAHTQEQEHRLRHPSQDSSRRLTHNTSPSPGPHRISPQRKPVPLNSKNYLRQQRQQAGHIYSGGYASVPPGVSEVPRSYRHLHPGQRTQGRNLNLGSRGGGGSGSGYGYEAL